MALGTYSRNDLLDAVRDTTADSGATNQVTIQDTINRAVRQVWLDVDFRSAKRLSVITPGIFDDIHQYTAPSDLKDDAIIDIRKQASPLRTNKERLRLVTPEEFDRKKNNAVNHVAVLDDEMTRTLLLDIDPISTKVAISSFDSLTGDGSNWAAFGDANNVELDTNNKIQGGASIRFGLAGSGVNAGLRNAGLNQINVGTEVFDSGFATVWFYLNSVTNFNSGTAVLRLGNDPSNYHETLGVGA